MTSDDAQILASAEIDADALANPVSDDPAQAVVWTNAAGGVSVCRPAPGVSIDAGFLARCPADALVVDETSLPTDADGFFEAWRLRDGQVVVDLVAAQAIQQERINTAALRVARDRADRAAIGLSDDTARTDFLAGIAAQRAAVSTARTLADLRASAGTYKATQEAS
jgi:hypothetical protein